MLLEGTVINGAIVLDGNKRLPEGARVEVGVKGTDPRTATPAGGTEKPTLRGLLKFAGTLSDLPADFAAEHDHYIHGTPKRNQKES